jgi:hypothetical protein
MKKPANNRGKLKIPMEFQAAISSFLKIKPEPKKKRGQAEAHPRKG